jgi:hypothetical protein
MLCNKVSENVVNGFSVEQGHGGDALAKHGNQELGGMLLSCLDQTSLKFGSLLQRITDKRKRKNVEMKLNKSLE